MHCDVERVVFNQSEISSRVAELGSQITKDYAGESLIVVGILRGAAIFMADLVRCIDLSVELDFMKISSYGSGTKSSGTVDTIMGLSSSIEGKNVLIVEDVLDSGLTLQSLLKDLEQMNPRSLAVAVLLKKDIAGQADVNCRYVGFECPNEFVVGYGLDYDQKYRHLPYVGSLKPEIYEK